MVSLEASLRSLARLGFQPQRIVDVGAFQGDWARYAKKAFPRAEILMIEAQDRMRAALEATKDELGGGVDFHIALLGPAPAESVPFYELETGSGVLFEQSSVTRNVVQIPMETLDEVVKNFMPGGADFLKLDVQGYELEVLKGGTKVLKSAQAVVMEVSLLPVNRGAPLLHDVTHFMLGAGFVAYDICGLVRRPLDNALWQIDLIFLKEGSALRATVSYD